MSAEQEKKNMDLMQTLDDAWNNRDWTRSRSATGTIRWFTGLPNLPRTAFMRTARRVFRCPWTCSIARFTGTMQGPMLMANGSTIKPAGKNFEVDFCTVARWHDSQIVEENLFYDVVGMMSQLGIGA